MATPTIPNSKGTITFRRIPDPQTENAEALPRTFFLL